MSGPLTSMDEVFQHLNGGTVSEIKIDLDQRIQLLLENNTVVELGWSHWRLDQGQSTVCTRRDTSEWCEETDASKPISGVVEPFFENLRIRSIQFVTPGDLTIKFTDDFQLEVFVVHRAVFVDWMIVVDGWRYGLKEDLGFNYERYPREAG